jgi:hypothetical protein
MNTPFDEGMKAYNGGLFLEDNPYPVNSQFALEWENGYLDAEEYDVNTSSGFTYDHEYDGWWTP